MNDKMRQLVEGMLEVAGDKGLTLAEMKKELEAAMLAELTRQVQSGTVVSDTVRRGNPIYRIDV